MTEIERNYVQDSIQTVITRFRATPNVFLTEDDLRTHLCMELLRHFNTNEPTHDGDSSISLHSEVRWYGDGTLKLRSDIVLVDVSTLKVLQHSKMPSKGYGFDIPKGIIEIKFRRPNGPTDTKFREDIENDRQKLEGLKRVFQDAAFWVVVLDKKKRLDPVPSRSDNVLMFYEQAAKIPQSGRELLPSHEPLPNNRLRISI